MNKTEVVNTTNIANELLAQLRAEKRKSARTKSPFVHIPHAPIMNMKGRYSRITLQTRWAWRWTGRPYYGHDRKLAYTGGVLIKARIPSPKYCGMAKSKEWSMKSPWTSADYARMVDRAITWAIKELRTQEYREQLHDAFEAAPQALRDASAAHGTAVGWPVMYDEMTIDNCNQWLDWLKEKQTNG